MNTHIQAGQHCTEAPGSTHTCRNRVQRVYVSVVKGKRKIWIKLVRLNDTTETDGKTDTKSSIIRKEG